MNKKQKIVIAVMGILIIWSIFFPPTVVYQTLKDTMQGIERVPSHKSYAAEQIIIVLVLGGFLIFIFKDRGKRE